MEEARERGGARESEEGRESKGEGEKYMNLRTRESDDGMNGYKGRIQATRILSRTGKWAVDVCLHAAPLTHHGMAD